MARLAAQEKGEYYPTPPEVVEILAKTLVVEERSRARETVVRLFDPCAGEGAALAQMAKILREKSPRPVETWGVEINPRRAELAAERLDTVIAAPFETVGWTPAAWGAVSAILLNPPYDDSLVFGRLESAFLKRATEALVTGGLLIFIIPTTALRDYWLANFLYRWYEDIRVWRFPDGLYEQFRQIVITGRKLSARDDMATAHGTLLGDLCAAWYDREYLLKKLSPLPETLPTLAVPTVGSGGRLFRAMWSPEEIEQIVEESPNDAIAEWTRASYQEASAISLEPLVSPKRGHIAQLLAAGLMGTLRLPGEVVKGRAVKSQILVNSEEDENGVRKETFRDVYTTHIVRVDRSGLEYVSKPDAVTEFLRRNADRLAQRLRDRLKPYGEGATADEEAVLDTLSKGGRALPGQKLGLLPDQRRTAVAVKRSLQRHGVAHLIAEMGYGKTRTALATVAISNAFPALVICPPHLVEKWQREVEETIPGARAVIVEDIAGLRSLPADERLVVIISRSYVKLGPGWRPAFARKTIFWRRDGELKAFPRSPVCPDCGEPLVGSDRSIRDEADLTRRPRRCPACRAALWQHDESGARRWPLADYIRRRMRGFFRILVVDEAHQYKAKESDQGWAFGVLANAIPWTLTLTGTFFGGPSTSIFWLLHRTQRNVREAYRFHEEKRWVQDFGVEERTIRRQSNGVSYYRGRERVSVSTRERPGIGPGVVRYLLETAIFRSVKDVGVTLPAFRDEVVALEMSPEQSRDYQELYNFTWDALLRWWPRYTASWLQWCLARPNSAFREETVETPDMNRTFGPVVDQDDLLPKEQYLVEAVKTQLMRRRRCIIYVRQTGTRDIRQRLVEVLHRSGVKNVAVLRESISPAKREQWLKRERPDVLITNPKLVETGLDLVEYSTIFWYEPDYSLYTLWQAARRVWRLGQTQPVEVYYLVYQDAMEDQALRLIGQKMAAAQLLYGDDVAGAIVPEMDDNLVVQLVQAIKAGEQWQAVSSLFGDDDGTTQSPTGSPTRISPRLLWEDLVRQRDVLILTTRRRTRSGNAQQQLSLFGGL